VVSGEWVCGYSLDSLEKINLTKNFILKIDVEGAEQTISRLRPIIMCEVIHANSISELPASKVNKKNIRPLSKLQVLHS